MNRNKNEYIFHENEVIVLMKGGKQCRISKGSFEKIWPYTWCAEGTGYAMSRTSGKAVKMHRIILGAKKGQFVDHVDGDGFNNSLENLRLCRKQQNEFNSKIRADNSTGYKGVSFIKKSGRYRAYINKNGIRYELGTYETKVEAAQAYNEKALELFGEFARLNEIVIGGDPIGDKQIQCGRVL